MVSITWLTTILCIARWLPARRRCAWPAASSRPPAGRPAPPRWPGPRRRPVRPSIMSPVNISCLARVGPSAVGPHRGGRAAPDARGHVADARVVGHHQQVAAQRDVAAAGHRVAVHLGDGRLGAAPQAHEVLGVALHVAVVDHRIPGRALLLAGVVDVGLAEVLQVVAGAEALAGAVEHDHVHVVVGVGPLAPRRGSRAASRR